jgi:GntR family transcriptional repressor for pyruvate dehydrogenase complex
MADRRQIGPKSERATPAWGPADDASPLGPSPSLTGRSGALSARIIDDVRAALLERQLRPGDPVGTEKELAARYDVSRIVARDALRSLQALGIVDIRMGKGGGARVAAGNPRLFAEALAIQLDLIGVDPGEVIDAQRAVECMAAELAAERATKADHERIRTLIAEAEARIEDRDDYTRLSKAFHFAVAEASHNRVLVVQLVSLDHVAWPLRNTTLTPAVSRRVLDVHKELATLIEMRDPAGARRLMDEHMRMIRSRRVSERGRRSPTDSGCC